MSSALPSVRKENSEISNQHTIRAVDPHWGSWRPRGEADCAPPLAAHFRESLRGGRLPPPIVIFRLSPRHHDKLHAGTMICMYEYVHPRYLVFFIFEVRLDAAELRRGAAE